MIGGILQYVYYVPRVLSLNLSVPSLVSSFSPCKEGMIDVRVGWEDETWDDVWWGDINESHDKWPMNQAGWFLYRLSSEGKGSSHGHGIVYKNKTICETEEKRDITTSQVTQLSEASTPSDTLYDKLTLRKIAIWQSNIFFEKMKIFGNVLKKCQVF